MSIMGKTPTITPHVLTSCIVLVLLNNLLATVAALAFPVLFATVLIIGEFALVVLSKISCVSCRDVFTELFLEERSSIGDR
jgi:hypothetical protein